jgi:hypothetical protein
VGAGLDPLDRAVTAEDWLLLALLAHVLVVFCVVAYAAIVRRESWLSPIMIFVGFLELFTLPLPLRALQTMEIEGNVTEHLPQIFPYLAPSIWLVTGGLLIFATCYYLPVVARWAAHMPQLESRPERSFYLASGLLAGFSLVLIAILARAMGGILPFLLLGYGGTSETYGRGYLAIGFPWLFVAVFLLLARYATSRSGRDLTVFALAFGLVTAMNLVMGNRSGVLYQLMAIVVFWHLAIHRIILLRFTPFLVIAFLALNLFGSLRSSGYESVSDFLTRSRESFSNQAQTGSLQHSAYYTLTTGEFVVPFETLPTVMQAMPDQIPFRLGRTFAEAFAFVIPSVLWADRPLPLPNWYMQQFYGLGYGLNEGRAFFFLAEGYLNFGPVGVAMIMAAWGIGCGIIGSYERGQAGSMNPCIALCLALSIAFIFRGIAGDSRSILIGLPEQSLVPAVLATAYLSRLPRQRR